MKENKTKTVVITGSARGFGLCQANLKAHPFIICLMIFIICAVARIVEYFSLRTDETAIAENFFHKLFGLGVLMVVLKMLSMTPKDIGFNKGNIGDIGKGLLLGLCCFGVSYATEMAILAAEDKSPMLEFYATGFSLDGGESEQTGIVFIVLCLLFNLINVLMEEGIFRGMYLKLLEPVSGFAKANLFAALLFGIWHWVMPMRSYIDGDSSLTNLLVMGIGYILLAGIMSIKWGLLYKMTGSLWAGLGDHLFNNVIATNLVHVIADGEADSLQIVRIMIAQLLSFAVVATIYKHNHIRKSLQSDTGE